jgi:phosphate transport system protein
MNQSLKKSLQHPPLLKMGALVQTQVACALTAMTRPTKGLVVLALRREDEINSLEHEVLLSCQAHEFSSTQRISIARAAKDLERMGDEAKKIIAKCLVVHGENFIDLGETPPIMCMAHHAYRNTTLGIEGLSALNALSAQAIVTSDFEIDAELEEVLVQITEVIHENPLAARSGIDTVFIAKAWERIGDHAKNLAEIVLEITAQIEFVQSLQLVNSQETSEEISVLNG